MSARGRLPQSWVGARDLDAKSPTIEHYMDQGSGQIVSTLTGLTERLLLCSEDLYIAIADAYRYRKELS